MQQNVNWSRPVKIARPPDTSRMLVLYYAATVVFLVLDFVLGFNVRIAFLEPLPMARIGYYGVCFTCLALMIWRPAWIVLISAFESLVTLSALIISLWMRTLLMTERVLETGSGFITVAEIVNFLISGSVAYIAWVRGVNQLKNRNRP